MTNKLKQLTSHVMYSCIQAVRQTDNNQGRIPSMHSTMYIHTSICESSHIKIHILDKKFYFYVSQNFTPNPCLWIKICKFLCMFSQNSFNLNRPIWLINTTKVYINIARTSNTVNQYQCLLKHIKLIPNMKMYNRIQVADH